MSPRQGKARLRRFAVAAACALSVAAAGWPSAAAAETASPSVAAEIAHAEFLPYMDPPPVEPATVCLVDTGVDLNPDTESNVVSRIALDGGDGGDVWDRKHGTEMAMMMGAPINGWGTVGAWPLVRIVSVRAMPPGASGFAFNAYARSILACLNVPGVRVINLSFSGPRPTDTEIADFNEYVARASRADVSVVAGAGNGAGEVEYPAAADDRVLAIAAAGPDSAYCAFSGRGPDVAVAGPGCGVDLADPGTGSPVTYSGTSPAAAFVSAILAALRSYRPDLGARQVEDFVRRTARNGVIDAAEAFRVAGVGSLVSEAQERAPHGPSPTATPDNPHSAPLQLEASAAPWSSMRWDSGVIPQWPRPRVRKATCGRHKQTLRLANREPAAKVVVRLYRREGEFQRKLVDRRSIRSSVLSVPIESTYATVQYAGGRRLASPIRAVPRCGRHST